MSIKKKIFIGIATFALVIAISFGAVLAAQSFTVTTTANVSFDIGNNIQCRAVWCQFIQFNSTGNANNTFNSSTKVSEKPAQYIGLDGSASNAGTTTWNFGQMEFASKNNCWLLVVFIEINGQNNVQATITRSPITVSNLVFGNYQKTKTVTKTGTAPGYTISSISSLTNIANPGTTGVTINGNTVGGATNSQCIIQKITITNTAPAMFSTSSVVWTITLNQTNLTDQT